MKDYSQVAVVNANAGAISDVIYLLGSKLNVPGDVANNATNKSWEEKIPWDDIISWSRTLTQAGAYKKVKVDLTSLADIAAGNRHTVKVKQLAGAAGQELYQTALDYYSVTGSTKLSIAIALYNMFVEVAAHTNLAVTHTPINTEEYFFIEGQFTDDGKENFDMSVVWDAVGSTAGAISTEVEISQPIGVEDVVEHYASGKFVTGKTYAHVVVNHYTQVANPPFGHKAGKPTSSLILINEDVLADFDAEMFPLMTGSAAKTITGASAADPCVVTSASHGFVVGDRVFVKDIVGDMGTGLLNDVLWKVTAVGATFTLGDADSTGLTYTSGGKAYKVDNYNGKEYIS